MKAMPWAEFTTDLCGDAIADEVSDEFVQRPSKGVGVALAEKLIRCGCEVSRLTASSSKGGNSRSLPAAESLAGESPRSRSS